MMSLFDVTRVPFSYFGSWMSIAIPRGKRDLFFRNHHGKNNNLFAIACTVNGNAVVPEIDAEPERLLLKHGSGWAEICFAGADEVRMRGAGLGLKFSGERIHAYRNGPKMAVYNIAQAYRRYQFEVLKGDLTLHGEYAAAEEDLDNMATHLGDEVVKTLNPADRDEQCIMVTADDHGEWEVAIDEFWSSWQRPVRSAFDVCLSDAKDTFDAFCAGMPAAPDRFDDARRLASYVNWSCILNPAGLIKRQTLFMSKNWMNNVWSWDQCYNAMAMARGVPALAMDQMLTLVDHQDAFGAYPDCFNDVTLQYNYSKPPVHGLAFSEIRRRLPAPLDEAVLERMYRSLGKQVAWWMTYRRMEGQALPYYLHGNDSGWDNSTMFEQGVPLIGPDLSALLVEQMSVLSSVALELGLADESRQWRDRWESLFEALMSELWTGEQFVAKLANSGTVIACQSLIPKLVLVLGDRLPVDVREALKSGMERHLTAWGLATEAPDSLKYIDDGYWRGPIWAPSTFLAVVGLERSGYPELAKTVAERFCRLCAHSGFAENFNALTGEPLRDPAYTWTSSVFLLMGERLV